MAFAYKPPHSKMWRIGFYDDITRKFKSISAKTKIEAEAKRKAKTLSAEKRLNLQQTHLIKSGDRTVTLSEGLKLFFSQKNIKPSTQRAYQLAVDHFIKSSKDKLLYQYNRIDAINLNLFLNKRTRKGKKETIQNISINTKANYTRHLFALFQWFNKNKLVEENFITKINAEKKQVEVITQEDLITIFTALDEHTEKRNSDLIKLKYFAAYRAEELLKSAASDFDFENKIVSINNFKGNRRDEIPMVNDLHKHLLSMELPASGRITKLSYMGLRSAWRRVIEKLGFNYNLHQLRKTRGTNLANSGVSPFFLHKFMRHENMKTTLDYYIRIDLKKMADEINSKLEI